MKTLILAAMAALTMGSAAMADVVYKYRTDVVVNAYTDFMRAFDGEHVIHEVSNAIVNDDGTMGVSTTTLDYFYSAQFNLFAPFFQELSLQFESVTNLGSVITEYDSVTSDLDTIYLGGRYLDSLK